MDELGGIIRKWQNSTLVFEIFLVLEFPGFWFWSILTVFLVLEKEILVLEYLDCTLTRFIYVRAYFFC